MTGLLPWKNCRPPKRSPDSSVSLDANSFLFKTFRPRMQSLAKGCGLPMRGSQLLLEIGHALFQRDDLLGLPTDDLVQLADRLRLSTDQLRLLADQFRQFVISRLPCRHRLPPS